MVTRILSAIVGIPLLLGLTYLGDYYMAFFVFVLSLIALYEFLRIGEKIGLKAWYPFGFFGLLTWYGVLFFGNEQWLFPVVIILLLVSFASLALMYPRVQFAEVSYNFLGFFYTTVLLSHLYLLRQSPDGLFWVLFTFLLVWGTDTGAYFVGRAIGKHKLAPLVSPKKTVEGSIGGLVFSIIIALIFASRFDSAVVTSYVFIGLIVGCIAQIGDLFESALKRSAGVKDSGNLIPGHGGILDRFDSFIVVVPIMYYLVTMNISR